MPTTTIRIEEALKARISAAAERAGKSSHAFILDALSETLERVEMDDALHQIADQRWASLVSTGESIGWSEATAYLRSRAAGQKPRKPAARKLAR